MERKEFNKNEVIFREGETGLCMYDIISGTVGIYAEYGTPNEKRLTTLIQENVFGEMGMVEHAPRSATAVALEKSVIKVINEEDFQAYLQERPSAVLAILQHTSGRVRQLSRDYIEACETVDEYIKADKAGEKKSPELMAKMKEIVRKGSK